MMHTSQRAMFRVFSKEVMMNDEVGVIRQNSKLGLPRVETASKTRNREV